VRVNDDVVIPHSELVVRATRSGGPGGQHVNTSSTRIETVWNVRTSQAVDDVARARIERALSARIDSEGNLRIVASDTRSQRRNRELAALRLAEAVRAALHVPKARRRTRPPRGAVEQRLEGKRHRAGKKRERRESGDDD